MTDFTSDTDLSTLATSGNSSTGALDPSLAAPPSYSDRQNAALVGAGLAANEGNSSDQSGFFSAASDYVTKGVPLTAAATANSFINTAVEVGNVFGADLHKATIEDEFGPNSDYTDYYNQHQGLVEGGALLAGSLLPGLGAVKLLKLAQVGKFGATISTATGLFSGVRDAAIADGAADLVGNSTGASLFGLNNLNKIKAVAAGAADQALQGAVFQTATLATMHASPLLDNNTMADNVSDVWDAMKGFGVVGGIFEGAGAISAINRAARTADFATKAQELVGATGLGNVVPGDRALNLFTQLDAIPKTDLSRLATQKLTASTNTTNRLITEQMIKAAGGDAELGNAFANKLFQWKAAGMDNETLSNNLSQLTKIGRHGDTGIASTSNDVFYLPDSIQPAAVPMVGHTDLMGKIATGAFENSKAYQLADPNTLPTIARATDALSIPSIQGGSSATVQKFSNSADAFKQGNDIFLGSQGEVVVNPKSTVFSSVPRPGESRQLTPQERMEYNKTGNLPPNSAPLNAVGLTMDLSSGKLYGETPLPVVGDIAKPKLVPSGLQVGDNIFAHSASAPPTLEEAAANPLSANARYVWASLRGIKSGDAIASDDLPMLEQLRSEMAGGTSGAPNNVLKNKGLSNFTDGTPIPSDATALTQHIADVKQAGMASLISAGKDADTIGQVLNAPQKALTNNFSSLNPSELITDPAQHMEINHVRLAYDIGSTKDSEGNLLRGLQATAYRTQLASTSNTNAVTNYLSQTVPSGEVTSRLSSLQFTKGVGDADILGAGNGFFTNANADYGTFAEQAQRIGRSTSELALQKVAKVSDTLAPAANALKGDQAASAELGNFIAVRRSTAENYVMLSDDVAKANNLPPNTAVLEGAVSKDAKTGAITLDRSYLPSGFIDGSVTDGSKGLRSYYSLSQPVADWERASQQLNADRNELRQGWWQAQGISKPAYNPDVLYAPPINTARSPFLAYVRQREGYAMGESGASVITAQSAAELQQKIDLLGPSYDAFTKGDIAAYKKAQGEYDFNRNFANNQVATEMARKGILNNVVPETRADNIISDVSGWHNAQETLLLRDHVELHNAQIFAQLRAMGDRFDLTGNSQFGAQTPFSAKSATNPYQSYIKTALGLGNKDDYPLWQLAQEKLQSFGDSAFNAVRDAFGATRKGILPVEDAAKVSEKFGLGNPYGAAIDDISRSARDSAYYGGLANQLPPPNILGRFVGTANSALGATVIRLDAFQQLIHAVTTPVMVALEHGPATREIGDLLTTQMPGSTMQVPSFSKTLYNAVSNYFSDASGQLQDLYKTAGLTRDELSLHRQMIDSLSLPAGKLDNPGWAQKIDSGAQAAEGLMGTRFVNKFNHFIAADVGRQIGEAQGLTGQSLIDTIGTFTNRVLGNQAAGQRAQVFTGPVGQAVGLFQSYQMNLMQQLFRHVGNGDIKSLAIGAGMQSSIFGLSSLPGFTALNNMIQDRHGNVSHQDLYSAANETVGHTAANYLLYGSLSGLLGSALYSRGDLNPRRASILPLNPMNFPSVQAGMKVYTMLDQLQSNVEKSGSVPSSLLLAAEHNGLSRPLTGLAEMIQGFATDQKGNLISAQPPSTSAGYSDLFSIANLSRILGARPLDEAVGLDTLYRQNAARVTDMARIQTLGAAAKTALYNGSEMAPAQTQQFMTDYARAGGNQTHFNQWMLGLANSANTSAVNKTFDNFRNPTSKTVQGIMGGVPLTDFRNQPTGGTGVPMSNTAGITQAAGVESPPPGS